MEQLVVTKTARLVAQKTHLYIRKVVLPVNLVGLVNVADKNDKWPDNIDGFVIITGKKVSFYVDYECILCSVCSDAAPKNFKISDDDDHDIQRLYPGPRGPLRPRQI